MQGGIETDDAPTSVIDKLKGAYDARVPITELARTEKISIPADFNIAIERTKKNSAKFAFYYLLLFAILDFFFIIFNKILVFPIAITIGFMYLCYEPVTIQGHQITKIQAIIGCVFAHLIICSIFTVLASSYVYLFALNAFCVFIVVAHCSILDTADEEEEKV